MWFPATNCSIAVAAKQREARFKRDEARLQKPRTEDEYSFLLSKSQQIGRHDAAVSSAASARTPIAALLDRHSQRNGGFPPFFGGQPAPAGGALANRGPTFPHSEELEGNGGGGDLRKSPAARWRLKAAAVKILREASGEGRSYAVCGCGHAAVYKDGDGQMQTVPAVQLQLVDNRHVRVQGTLKCQSPWHCPTCAPVRAKRRQERLQEVMERTAAKGGTSAFVTLTVSHDLTMSLADVKKMLSTASRRARQGRKWKDIALMADILGVVQGVEVLHNKRTGWHYHAHLLVPCLGSRRKVRRAMAKMVSRYMDEIAKLGGTARMVGQDIQIVGDSEDDGDSVAKYAAKGSASWEIAGGIKEVRAKESRTPWDLVQLANAGDEQAKALFIEYADAMVGTRSCVVSASLASKLGMVAEDDEEGMEVEEEDVVETKVEIVTEKWRKLLSYGVAWKAIEAVEMDREAEDVKSVVDGLVSSIDRYETRQRMHEDDRARRMQTVAMSADDLADTIVRRRRTMGWDRAKRSAIADHSKMLRLSGKIPAVPSDVEMGRAISRRMEAEWS